MLIHKRHAFVLAWISQNKASPTTFKKRDKTNAKSPLASHFAVYRAGATLCACSISAFCFTITLYVQLYSPARNMKREQISIEKRREKKIIKDANFLIFQLKIMGKSCSVLWLCLFLYFIYVSPEL